MRNTKHRSLESDSLEYVMHKLVVVKVQSGAPLQHTHIAGGIETHTRQTQINSEADFVSIILYILNIDGISFA